MALINKISWRLVAIGGGGALVLSFLLGLLSGNYLGICLVRAMIFGFSFAILAAGSDLLLKHFCPELFQGPVKAQTNNRKKVDLVLDDTPDLKPADLFNNEKDSFLESPDNDEMRGELAEAPLEEANPLPTSSEADLGMENEVPPINDLAEEISPDINEQQLTNPEEEVSIKRKSDKIDDKADDLDSLPDLSSFESVFAPVTGDNGAVVTDSFTNDLSSPTLKAKRIDKDPVTYAKALRTILKRDEGKSK